MKRVASGMFAVLGCAALVTLSAQTPPPSETQQTPPSSAKQGPPSADAENKVSVTGCLERAKESASPTGTSGAGASSETTKFVLNNVTSSPSGAATTGTAGSARATASSYRLDGDDSKLTPHVGHKIQISGTVENRASAMGASASASAPKLKVESVTMLASSCTP
jgi:hypothetical protein